MKIGKVKFGWWRPTHESRGDLKPYLQILCVLMARPIHLIGRSISFVAVVVGEWSLQSAIEWWQDND